MWYLLLFLLMHWCGYAHTQGDIKVLIEQIPASDRKDLEAFFQLLINTELMGYTLFGDKPISTAVYMSLEIANEAFTTKYLILEKGWQAWLRNRHLFSQEHFAIKKTTRKIHHIYLINKKKTLEKIHENMDMFQLIGLDNPEEILSRICNDCSHRNILPSHSLAGIFYGYGKKNSQHFEFRTNLLLYLSSKMTPPFSAQKTRNRLDIAEKDVILNLAEDLNFKGPYHDLYQIDIDKMSQLVRSQKRFVLFTEAPFLNQFPPPCFISWEEEETKQLEESYHKTLSKMKEMYRKGPFLEITLQQWTNPQ